MNQGGFIDIRWEIQDARYICLRLAVTTIWYFILPLQGPSLQPWPPPWHSIRIRQVDLVWASRFSFSLVPFSLTLSLSFAFDFYLHLDSVLVSSRAGFQWTYNFWVALVDVVSPNFLVCFATCHGAHKSSLGQMVRNLCPILVAVLWHQNHQPNNNDQTVWCRGVQLTPMETRRSVKSGSD